MKLDYAERFIKSFEDAPPLIQKAFYKQSRLLLENPRHPSLRAKKYDEARDIWQARVTRDFHYGSEGLFFTVKQNQIRKHPVTKDALRSRFNIRPFHTFRFHWPLRLLVLFECEDRFEDLLSLTTR